MNKHFIRFLLFSSIVLFPSLSKADGFFSSLISAITLSSLSQQYNSDGTNTITATMSNGSQVITTSSNSVIVPPINVQNYCPSTGIAFTSNTITNGVTLQIPSGCTEAILQGSTGLIAGATIKLPPNPTDGVIIRIVLPAGLTITLLTIQDSTGNTITCNFCSVVVIGGAPLFQFESSNGGWRNLSKG